jgi:hypothetical protein
MIFFQGFMGDETALAAVAGMVWLTLFCWQWERIRPAVDRSQGQPAEKALS